MMKLDIKNFRSIKDQSVELAPITVLYGPNGSGKSSLIYALLIMKNVILNLEHQTGDFFNLDFANLGDFGAVVHKHRIEDYMLFEISTSKTVLFKGKEEQFPVKLRVVISKEDVAISLLLSDMKNSISYNPTMRAFAPYETLVGYQRKGQKFRGSEFDFRWEGIKAHVHTEEFSSPGNLESAKVFDELANSPIDAVRSINIAPLQMAFSKGDLSVATEHSSLYSTLYFSEDAVGTLLATRRYLQSSVSNYLEEITNRTLRVFSPPGDPSFSINVEDRSTGLETELVNDGYGVNRTAWLLALALHDETKWMCIEEPETHLHPSAVRKLTRTFVEIMRKEDKRFLLTTHSEALVLALLAEVSRKNLKPEEVAFYLTTKEGKETKFERQEVNELGQIDDGLSSFMEGEMEDIAAFFEQTG